MFFLFPTYWMLTSALKPKGATLTSDYDLIPFSVTLSNFITAWTKPGFLSSLGNSLLVTLTAVDRRDRHRHHRGGRHVALRASAAARASCC